MNRAAASRQVGLFLTGLLLMVWPRTARAHDPGLSTGQLHIQPGRVDVELVMARADVQVLTPLDVDGDGEVSPKEWVSAEASLNPLAAAALRVEVGGHEIPASSGFVRHDASNNVRFTASFPLQHSGVLMFRSELLSRLPRGHRQYLTVFDATGKSLSEALLSAERAAITVTTHPSQSGSVRTPTFAGFLTLGLEHIITGYDHLLFLFALLLMAPGFRQAAGIITSFTVAHSITLGLATLDLVHFPPRLVEPLIAASIVYVGVENVVRRDPARNRWLLTFAFGLVHGFGFASVLRELGVSSGSAGIATPLFAFNVGVETGQMAIAAAALPLLWQLKKTPAFVQRILPLCSSLVIALGAWWFLERTAL